MRVLVTGGAGWIGGYVCAELEKRAHEPVVFDGGSDVRDRDEIREAVLGVGAVVHLAAVLGTAETFDDEWRTVDVNVLGTVNVLDAVRERPLVIIGTGHRGHRNPYAATKACAEDLALGRAIHRGQPVNVVRAYNAYGPGQKVSPPHGTAPVRKMVPSMVCRALTGMPVEVFGRFQTIDLVDVADVATVLVDGLAPPYGRLLEAGTGVGTAVQDAARRIIEVCESNSPIRLLPPRPGDDGAPVVAQFPLCPHPWPWGLDETIAYYRDWLTR